VIHELEDGPHAPSRELAEKGITVLGLLICAVPLGSILGGEGEESGHALGFSKEGGYPGMIGGFHGTAVLFPFG
jgi:hypothetical protein